MRFPLCLWTKPALISLIENMGETGKVYPVETENGPEFEDGLTLSKMYEIESDKAEFFKQQCKELKNEISIQKAINDTVKKEVAKEIIRNAGNLDLSDNIENVFSDYLIRLFKPTQNNAETTATTGSEKQ